MDHLILTTLIDRTFNFTLKNLFAKRDLIALMAVMIAFIFPAQTYGQAGTLKFTEIGHHGNTLSDGDAGSTNISGISYNIYGADTGGAKVGDIVVLEYTSPLESHYFFVDTEQRNFTGLEIDRLVIESAGGETFGLNSFNLFDELSDQPQLEITGFNNGIPVATHYQHINTSGNIQINLNTDFENVDRVEISNQNGMITQSFNTFVFDYPVTLNAPPTVSTDSPTSISTTSATLGGNVSDDGGASVTERGIIYSTSANPTTADNTIQIGTGTGSFSQNVTGLSPGTTYFVRAYAINSEGTSYGTEQSFTTRVQVQSISRLDPANSLTNQDEVVFQVTFTGPVSGLSSDNFSLTESGLNGASLTSISGSGSTYDVTVHTGAGDGLLRLNVINDSNVTPSILGLPYTDGETYTIDKTPPTITSITSPEDPGPTLAQTLDITIEFSKPVYGFQFSDINVTGDAEVTFSGTDFTDGETSYTFTATHAEDGELNLHIPNETIQDQAGNLNSNTGSYSIQLIRNQPFAGGSGTEVDPWQVTTADELNRIRNFLDGHFILTDNIDLGVAPWNEIEGWAPIGNSANSFDGVLNGNGHSISNLYIDQNIEHVGLFGYIGEDAHISNIRITNADISSNQERVGILAGSLDGHVYEIEVSGTVSGNGRVGGLAGESGEHSTIFKAAAFVEVISTSERAGGLLGANSADISHSYARGTVTGTNRVGGLIGNAFDGAITNNYVSVELSGGSWVRGLVGDRRDNTAGSFSDNYVDEDIANTTNPGNGTFLSSDEMTLYKTFVDAGWNFDTIWGFNHEENDSYPFLKFQNQFTHNLRNSADLADLTVSGDIENLHFDPNTTDYELKVKNDVTSVDVSFSLADGSTGSIESPQTVHLTNGSGVFSVEVTAEDLLTTKTYIITVLPYFESGSGTEADPFVLNTLEQLSNINHFLDSHFVLSQDIDASDTENWNEGEGFEPISASFTGTFNGQGHLIKNLYINRPGSTHTGLFSTITGSAHIHNLGIVDADITGGERTGILAGESRASISEVFTTGAVHGSHYTGGIIGIVEGDNIISRSYSTADVSSSSSRVGGITGYLYGLIEDSYFYDGSVTGISVTGGIAGEIFSGTIERSYVANSLLSDSGIASLSQAGSTVTNSFWDIETTGTTTSAGGTGLTTAELKSKSLFTDSGWDFDTVWQIDTPTDGNISYPYLQQNTQQPAPGFMEVQQPEVVTNSTISDITSGSAVVSGEIIHDGNLPISEVGYSWAPADTPDDTTMVFATLDGTGFTSTLSDLPPGTDIRVIAFASNEIGSSFGESVEFATEKAEVQLAGSFTTDDKSYDGNTTASIQDNNLTLTGVYGSHDLSITDIHVVFENSNASTDLEITIVSATLSGADSDRYLLSLDNAPTSIATILPRQIAVTADDQAVVYGEDDPSLSYTVTAGKLVGDDQFSGDLSRESGLNTGIYEILKGDLTAGDNYEITFHSANFEITPRTLTVRADAGLSKHYGDADPELTFDAENFGWDDDEQVFSGELSRESGESAGTYNITPGNLDAGDNYTIDFTGAEFTILTYGLLVRAEADQAKTYGEADPTLTYTVNGEPASNYESVLSGDLSRQSGEDAGQYAITQGNLSAGSDYTITFEPEDFTITPATLTITADTDQSKTYGEDDPELTFNADGFAFDDDLSLLSGALSRESGESIGDYAIQQGDLDAGDNYTIDFTGAEFTILSYGLLVQAEADQAKIYGEADPTLTYTVNGEPASNYESVLSGTLSRQSGEDAGQYAITQGNLSAGSDYTITFEPEDFTITPATLAITADTDQSKTYGEDDPELTFTANGFVFDDDLSLLSGSLSRNEGENTGDYLITLGDLDAYSIELHPGWNIISNPHSGSVSWSDVQELNDITGEIFAYNQHFMSTDSLQPVQGYYYYNDPTSEASILEIPYSTMDQRRSNEGEQAAKSRLNASMLAAPATAGITAHFDQGPDLKAEMVYDVPTDDRGRYLRPYPSLEMSRTGMMFIDDSIQRGGLLRAESYYHSEGNEYSLELKGEVGDRFVWRVSLSGLGNRARVLLINPVSNVSWILADGEEAEARMSEPTTTYRVFIGDEHYLTEMQQDLMPQEVSLQPNYPNPFNPATNIRYSIPQQQHVRLVVYDVIGRRVQVLQDGIQQAGWHNAQFDAGNLASGVYFYRLQVGEVMHTGRMTLIK